MNEKKHVFVIVGSASSSSTNEKLMNHFARLTTDFFDVTLFSELKSLPHFDPELSIEDTPKQIINFRAQIEQADGILICTPEYVFSIPSGLKNAIEWCVSSVVFTEKRVGIITASANGEKGHTELQLIMKTLSAQLSDETTLLIQGIKGKLNEEGEILDVQTELDFQQFIQSFKAQLNP